MRKSIIILSGCILLGGGNAVAQSPSEEFNQFRQKILSDFSNFKSRILEHYGDFLNGEWHEFEPLWEEASPYTQPKPTALPEIPTEPEAAPAPDVAKLPAPKYGNATIGGVLAPPPGRDLAGKSGSGFDSSSFKIDVPLMGGSKMPQTMAASPNASALRMSESAGKSSYELAAMRLPDPGFAFGDCPGQIAAPSPGESGIISIETPKMEPTLETNNFLFDFYGMEAFIPENDFTISATLSGPEQSGAHWSKMAAQESGLETSRQLFGLAQQLGLNGYLTFRLVESYVNNRFKDSDANARMSAVHFLLSNMGYDARLLKLADVFTIMMPFDQKVVYATMSQTLDGRKYTILYPDGWTPPAGQALKLYTCNLPQNALGKTSDLRLTGLNLPMKPKSFNVSNNKLTLSGEVNENFQKLLHRYPQMPTGDFASSWVDSKLRENIVAQLKNQLSGMSEKEAVNSLMSLCHRGFNYSTDQDFHGFEKPYFLEENFIYDKNDCEDRAIFFSYLVWNALNLPCQLVQYPGHESATVAVDEEISGYFYDTEGKKFYSADPTYIGSTIGMVMKPFRTTSPAIDKEYK